MNQKEELAPELEKLISKIKLKEPSRELMKDYLSGVNAKIDQGIRNSNFGFPQFAVFMAIGMALVGFLYFLFVHLQTKPVSVKTASVASEAKFETSSRKDKGQTSTQKALTLEEEVAILKALGDESSDELSDVFGDEEALDELVVLDEVELSPGLANQPPRI